MSNGGTNKPSILHPQTRSFLNLFPKPGLTPGKESMLARWLDDYLTKDLKIKNIPSFIGLSADVYGEVENHDLAEKWGNDCSCNIIAHFDDDLKIPIGTIPYPNNSGEFVIGGHRYFVPMFLRTERQLQKIKESLAKRKVTSGALFEKVNSLSVTNHTTDTHDIESGERNLDDEKKENRKTDSLRVILIGDLIEMRIIQTLMWVLKNARPEIEAASAKDLKGILKTYLGNSLSKSIRRYLVLGIGRRMEMSNPISRFCQRKELSFFGPWGVHPESVGKLELRDVDDGDLYRLCPVQTPQGHAVGLRLYLARLADVDEKSGILLKPANPKAGDSLGDAASLIPFVEHDDASRALMGANMIKQALPLEKPQPPFVQTGWEKELASSPVVLDAFKRVGLLSYGTNLLTGYLPWGLDTFEDGIVISQSGATALSSVQGKTFWFDEKIDWDEGRQKRTIITRDNPDISEAALEKLDKNGIIKIRTKVKPGDVLVSALFTRSGRIHKTQIIDQLMLALFPESDSRDASFRMRNFSGEVVEIIDSASEKPPVPLAKKVLRRVGVRVRRVAPVAVGDKLAGRHGNKGVVVRILPDHEMPYIKDSQGECKDNDCPIKEGHRHLQLILNPLGVTGRLNVGQLYETALGKVAGKLGRPFVVSPFLDKWSPKALTKILKENGFAEDGKEQLYIYNGDEQPLRYRSLAGAQYIVRLYHTAGDKVHGRGIAKPSEYTIRDDQPRRGRLSNGGQRIGEMETWALAGHSGWHLLDDLLNVKSDDVVRRKNLLDKAVKWDGKRRPKALANLILMARGLGIDLRLKKGAKDVTDVFLEKTSGEEFSSITVDIPTLERIKEWKLNGEILSTRMYEIGDELYLNRGGLLSRTIFERPWQMGKITFAHPIVHPLAAKLLWEIFNYPKKFKKEAPWKWGTELFERIHEQIVWPDIINSDAKNRLYHHRVIDSIKGLKGDHRIPMDYVMSCLPVIPPRFRWERIGKNPDFEHDLNKLYVEVMVANSRLKELMRHDPPALIMNDGCERLFNAVNSLFFGKKGAPGAASKGLLGFLEGKDGLLRGHLAGKRVDFSGRAVIVGDPHVPLDEVYLPAKMSAIFQGMEGIDKPVVLLNRQPSLHRYSILAFRGSLHDNGDVIRLNPFVCKPFNADFDGDTMAVHVPRKPQAQGEATKLLPSNNLFSQANGGVVLGFGADIALGALYISHHPDIQFDEKVPLTEEDTYHLSGLDIWDEFIVDGIKTTVGRLLLQRIFKDVPIPNRDLKNIKDGQWKVIIESVAHKGPDAIKDFTQAISSIVENVLKRSGLSLSVFDIDDLGVNFNQKLDDGSKKASPPFLWLSGQAGAKGDLKHLIGPRGEMKRPDGGITDKQIASGLIAGHSEEEYLISAHGTRAGLVDKGLNTAPAGIILRRLVYALQNIYIVAEDCQTSDGLETDQVGRLDGRFKTNGSTVEVSQKDKVKYRSPYTCSANDAEGRRGICQKCYGLDSATGKLPEIGLAVGILAAQAVGERASQLTLRTFHTGGGVEKTLDLNALRDMIFNQVKFDVKSALKWITRIMDHFEMYPDPPKQVHFEVILRGLHGNILEDNFLTNMGYSNPGKKLLFSAAAQNEDHLSGVISRILTGRFVKPVRHGRE